MDVPEKVPVSRESLAGFARYFVHLLAGRRNPPATLDVYSSRGGDGESVKLFYELLVSSFEEQRQLFDVRNKRAPVPRAFLEPASDFYSIDLGYYLSSGGIPADMVMASEAPFNPKTDSSSTENAGELCMPKFLREEKRILGHISWGSVIDHIPAGRVWRLVELLELDTPQNFRAVSLGDNYSSHKLGKKGVLKIQDYELDQGQMNSVAFYAEGSTLSTIRMGRVSRKIKMEVPEVLEGIVLCPDSECNSDSVSHVGKDRYRCNRCATDFGLDKLKFISYLRF